MKKKIFSLICIVVLVFTFASCSGKKSDTGAQNPFGTTQITIPNSALSAVYGREEPQKKSVDVEIQCLEFGKLHINSYALVKDYDGKTDCILFYADYTNQYEKDLPFTNLKQILDVYQGNIRLSGTLLPECKDEETRIKQNSSIEVVTAYVLRDTTTDITIECKDIDSIFDSETISIK